MSKREVSKTMQRKARKQGKESVEQIIQQSIALAGTVAELGRQINIEASAIHSWLSGSSLPRRSSVCRLKHFVQKHERTSQGGFANA